MTRKLFLSTTAMALLGLGMTPLFGLQMPGMQMPASANRTKIRKTRRLSMPR
jgi:hypothetical protein